MQSSMEVKYSLRHLQTLILQYKHHNTTNMLIVCTPSGAFCFIPLVRSILDFEVTRVAGFLEKLNDLNYGGHGIY